MILCNYVGYVSKMIKSKINAGTSLVNYAVTMKRKKKIKVTFINLLNKTLKNVT